MRIIAHRGARAEEPENTIRAIKRAAECGADLVELDLRQSKDHELVVIHDATLERTTNGSGLVAAHTLRQLQRLDAGKGEHIPALSEVLSLGHHRGIGLVLELKEPGIAEAVVHDVVSGGMTQSVIIASFFHPALLTVKAHAPQVKTGIILSALPVFPLQVARDAGAEIIFQRYPRLTREYVDAAAMQGIEIYAWVINTREDCKCAEALGVAGIATDNPCHFTRRCGKRKEMN
ncbi:MAG TPA: glycerophosphodiester phosphodiesterase [Methanomicrobia archaeon]|nr:glycerophosphodiester phosphodiesterase [Methanomicrobia archaeon]